MTSPTKGEEIKSRRLGEPDQNISLENNNQSQNPLTKDPEEQKREEAEERAAQLEFDRLQKEMNNICYIRRSDYISPVELQYLQSNYMKALQVGGFFGLDTIPLDKTNLFSISKIFVNLQEGQAGVTAGFESVPVIQTEPKRDYLKKDGIFTSATEFSLPKVEIQRLEQRLIWENKSEWFRPDNGKLIMDTEFFEEKITTMRDTATSKNPNLHTFKRNAYLSERQNQKKNQYYKLDLILGKVTLTNHPLFSEEDRKAAVLKAQVKDFRDKADIALIPHLRQQLIKLKEEYDQITSKYDVPPKQLEILEKEITLHENLLNQEVKDHQDLINRIYKTWNEIKDLRNANKYTSTTVRLNVREYMSEESDTKEIDLFTSYQEVTKSGESKSIPNSERNRRNRIAQNRVYLRVFINDNYVCRTRKQFVDWPNMEINFFEKFQVFLFTKPGSIKFQIVMGTFREYVIDTFEVDIPGETVNTLTSSSHLFREKEFKKQIPKTVRKVADPAEGQALNIAGEKKEEEKKDANSKSQAPKVEYMTVYDTTHSGFINYKAEWHGTGNSFPPPAIDKFGNVKHGGIKLKTVHSIDEGIIDLNDPRNETLIEQLRLLKNKQIQDLLNKDAMMPLADLDCLRHRVLRLRHQKIALSRKKIPLSETEVYNSEEFMQILKDEEEEIRRFLQDEYIYTKGMMLKEQALDIEKPPETQETKNRIKIHRKKLYLLSQETLKDKQKDLASHLNLKSVVNEFYFEEDTDPIAEFIKSLFEQRGKLRPKKKTQDKVSAKRTNQTDILIHCVKGTNVPVRSRAFMIVRALKEGGFTPNSIGLRSGGQGGYGNQMMGYNGPQQGYGGMPGMMNSQGFNPGMSQSMADPNLNQPMDQNMRQYLGRMDETRMAVAGGTPSDTLDIERVLSFVEISLYNPETSESIVVKTETFEGISPEWNDNLKIPYKALNPEGFDLKELLDTNCVLYFTLFDMVGVIQKKDKGINNFNINIEKRYLGSFQIPLVTLFQNPKMDAQFKVERPLFILGYYNMKANAFADQIATDPSQPTHITLSIGLSPVIEIPSRNESDYYGGGENPDLLMRGAAWIKHLKENSKFASKNLRLWAENINKKAKLESHFVSRYLTPLAPPFNEISEDSYNQCARYVSLIPFKSDAEAFKDVPDIWSTAQEFLDLKGGDSEEHAILLCCYFMYIDRELQKTTMKNYIIIGKGVPEGDTVYVLRKNTKNDDIEIWNATTGDPYFFKRVVTFNQCCGLKLNKTSQIDIELSDTICPLKEVTCVANDENVWINIQDDISPNTVIFDLDNKTHWTPFLDDKLRKEYFKDGKIETIQPDLVYDPINEDYANNLQFKLYTELRRRIVQYRASDDEGRKPKPTIFDDTFGSKVRDIMLLSFELFKYRTRTTGIHSTLNPKSNTAESLKQIGDVTNDIIQMAEVARVDIYGVPLNMPYVGIEKIWQMIKTTDICNIDSPDVKYVLEVGVKPYPHWVFSVWIYIGVNFTKPIK